MPAHCVCSFAETIISHKVFRYRDRYSILIITDPQALPEKDKRTIVFALLIVFLLAALDMTILSTAMPRIVSELDGLELYAWVSTSYMLASTVLVPIYGKLGDLYGRRRILVFGIVIFLLGSMLCGI